MVPREQQALPANNRFRQHCVSFFTRSLKLSPALYRVSARGNAGTPPGGYSRFSRCRCPFQCNRLSSFPRLLASVQRRDCCSKVASPQTFEFSFLWIISYTPGSLKDWGHNGLSNVNTMPGNLVALDNSAFLRYQRHDFWTEQPNMISQMLQNSTTYIYVQQDIIFDNLYLYSTIRVFFQLQPKLFSFNNNICSSSTQNNFIQRK